MAIKAINKKNKKSFILLIKLFPPTKQKKRVTKDVMYTALFPEIINK